MLIEVVLSCVALLVYSCCPCVSADDASTPDTTDVLVEDDWPMARSYRLEDFLWSGSGDGATEVLASPWMTTTVFRTTTVMATVFTTPVYEGSGEERPQPTPVWPKPTGVINPTPTLRTPPSTSLFPFPTFPDSNDTGTPDQRFWLLTVLIANNSLLGDTVGLEARLAHIYKIAFSRHQEHHLGIGNSTAAPKQVPSRYRRAQQTLSVHVHNMTTRGDREIELVYSVRVAGQPIPALTAADDMRLVSTAEVESELGYQVLTKAEPYLKTSLPRNGGVRMARGRDTWLMVGAAVSAVCLLLLLVALVALALGKRKRHPVATNRQQVFEREQGAGVANLGYEEEGVGVKNKATSHRSSSFQQATVSFQDDAHRLSSASSASSSQASLVRRRPMQGHNTRRAGKRGARRRTKEQDEDEDVAEKPQPKPRRRHHLPGSSKQQEEADPQLDVLDAGSNDELTEPPLTGDITRVGPAVSPNSLLSMPSVKSFPRGANIPEPLARVLEPANVDSEGLVILPQRLVTRPVKLSRHGSVEGEDPGVVGPLVWDLHCHHLLYQQQANKNIAGIDRGEEDLDDVEDMDDVDVRRSPGVAASNVGRMRRRFNELLDDAFSLFGSRSVSPDESSSPPLNGSSMHRVHSAIVRPVGEPFNFDLTPRPRTSGCRPATAAPSVARPRGAWATKEPSIASAFSGTLARPLSAGPFHRPQLTLSGEPIIERDLVLEDSQLAPSDPAVPLIAAIKEELRKFQDTQPPPTLPGAATPKT